MLLRGEIMEKLYTAQEIADKLNRKVETVWGWFRKGILKYTIFGRTKLVKESDLIKFIESGGNNGNR